MANGNPTNTIDPADVKNNQSNNSQGQNIPKDNGGSLISSDLFKALYSSTGGIDLNQVGRIPIQTRQTSQPKSEELETTEKPTKELPQRQISALLPPGVLKATVPKALQSSIDRVVTSDTLKDIGLTRLRQKPKEKDESKVEIKPIKVDSKVLEEIGRTNEPVIAAPPPVERRTTEEPKEKEEEKRQLESDKAAAEKFGFKDPTQQALEQQIPGTPKIKTKRELEQEAEETKKKKKPKRRRVRVRGITSSSISGISAGGLLGSASGSEVSSGGGGGGQSRPMVLRSTGQAPIAPGAQQPQLQTPVESGAQPQQAIAPAVQEPQQVTQPRGQSPIGRARQAYDQVQQLPQRLQDEFNRVQKTYDRIQNARKSFDRAKGFFKFGKGLISKGKSFLGLGGSTGTATATATGTAAGSFSIASLAIFIAALIVFVIVIAIVVYIVASMSATDRIASERNTAGNARAFFNPLSVQGGGLIAPRDLGISTAAMTTNSAGMITQVRIVYQYRLRSTEEYNRLFLGSNSNYYIEVNDINFKSQFGIPETFTKQDGTEVKSGFPDGYNMTTEVPALQPYPKLAGSATNLMVWQPAICDDTFARALNARAGGDHFCATGYLEKMALTLDFKEPIPPSAINNRLVVTLGGSLTVNYYQGKGGQLLGPQPITIVDQQICIDTSSLAEVECANSQNDPGTGPITGTIDTGSGTVVPGCPLAKNEGEFLTCTSGFDPNRVLSTGPSPHYANDMVVQNAAGQSLTERYIVSPVNGTIKSVAPESYQNLAGNWFLIQDDENPSVQVFLAHIQPGTNPDQKDLSVESKVTKGQILGVQYQGLFNALWQGAHLHFEVRYNGSQRGSDPEEYIQKGCNQPNYTCR